METITTVKKARKQVNIIKTSAVTVPCIKHDAASMAFVTMMMDAFVQDQRIFQPDTKTYFQVENMFYFYRTQIAVHENGKSISRWFATRNLFDILRFYCETDPVSIHTPRVCCSGDNRKYESHKKSFIKVYTYGTENSEEHEYFTSLIENVVSRFEKLKEEYDILSIQTHYKSYMDLKYIMCLFNVYIEPDTYHSLVSEGFGVLNITPGEVRICAVRISVGTSDYLHVIICISKTRLNHHPTHWIKKYMNDRLNYFMPIGYKNSFSMITMKVHLFPKGIKRPRSKEFQQLLSDCMHDNINKEDTWAVMTTFFENSAIKNEITELAKRCTALQNFTDNCILKLARSMFYDIFRHEIILSGSKRNVYFQFMIQMLVPNNGAIMDCKEFYHGVQSILLKHLKIYVTSNLHSIRNRILSSFLDKYRDFDMLLSDTLQQFLEHEKETDDKGFSSLVELRFQRFVSYILKNCDMKMNRSLPVAHQVDLYNYIKQCFIKMLFSNNCYFEHVSEKAQITFLCETLHRVLC